MGDKYILDGKKAVLCRDLMTWAKWFEKTNRHVADNIENDVRVSTIFLGLDHGYGGDVLLFETMVFGGEHDGHMVRYRTYDQAEAGHKRICEMVFGGRRGVK